MTPKSIPFTRPLLEVRVGNLLSFGHESSPLPLENLNILIGPNAAGKSNLIEAIALMRATPVADANASNSFRGVVRRGGGGDSFLWKGDRNLAASIDMVVSHNKRPLRHVVAFQYDEQGLRLHDERIEDRSATTGKPQPFFYYRFQNGRPVLNTKAGPDGSRKLAREAVPDFSILPQQRDPENYPQIAYLADLYGKFRIYREWTFGRNSVFREAQRADMRNDLLEEDFSNLGLVLSRLNKSPKAKSAILEGLKDLYDGVTSFDPIVEGGSVQVFFTEGDFSVPATRLSDGTLRYLCLLTILCDPQPPPLICIEEPELGLHPDILPNLARLLVEASQRTQLIVTTHSDVLVDAMTDQPEAIVVCEKHEGQTQMRRLRKQDLDVWLQEYRLGQLWTKGEIGGNRW